MVFQEGALFPWLKVIDNVEFGLKIAGIPKDERSQISKRYLVDIAQTTVFLDEKQKKIVSGNHKICNKHLASVWKMIYLCRILLIPSLLITFDSLIWHLLNQLFCETVPWYNISSNGPQLLKKVQHLVTSATHAYIF